MYVTEGMCEKEISIFIVSKCSSYQRADGIFESTLFNRWNKNVTIVVDIGVGRHSGLGGTET